MVGVYATAGSDASAQAKSQLFSIGYSQADATATIAIKNNVLIEAEVRSTSLRTRARPRACRPKPRVRNRAACRARSRAHSRVARGVLGQAHVHHHSRRYGRNPCGRTVNIRALGETESEAEPSRACRRRHCCARARAAVFTADILTQIDGKVTADMNTNGGEVVKFEFDPTVAAADYTSTQTATRLRTGETVQVEVEVNASMRQARYSSTSSRSQRPGQPLGADLYQPCQLAGDFEPWVTSTSKTTGSPSTTGQRSQ